MSLKKNSRQFKAGNSGLITYVYYGGCHGMSNMIYDRYYFIKTIKD
jgi:hypothetical protein